MKERPILMSTEMVKATLEDWKTNTRRLIKPQPPENSIPIYDVLNCYKGKGWAFQYPELIDNGITHNKIFKLPQKGKCPYGDKGDLLYVRERWCVGKPFDDVKPSDLCKWEDDESILAVDYFANDKRMWHKDYQGKWRPSIHMPKWAVRIWLEIQKVRIERLQDITQPDIYAEGIPMNLCIYKDEEEHRYLFKELWDSINAKCGYRWDINPWVWVIEFKRCV